MRLSERVYATAVDPAKLNGQQVTVAGWLQETRDLGGVAFLILRDRSGTLQVVLPKKKLDAALVAGLLAVQRESVVAIQGEVKASDKARNGYEILPTTFQVLNAAEAPLPLGVVDKVDANLDTRLDNRFMDLRKPEIQAVFRVRSTIVKAGLAAFDRLGFVQVHTPRIIGASSEGGTDVFEVKYFDKKAYLSQSPQLYKQMLMATGLDRVCEVATYFRAEKHKTVRHLNEITAFDGEMAFVESEEDVMQALETVVHAIWKAVAEENGAELKALGKEVVVPTLPFTRIKYDDAVQRVNATGRLERAIEWGEDLSTEAERVLGEELQKDGVDFYFITRYPASVRPFYTYIEDDAPVSRSFDLEFRGLEVTSGAQRQHDPAKLVKRMEQKGLNPADFEDYLKAFRYGMPPHGGFGLGIDRLVMQILGLPNVREGVLFPRDVERVTP